MEEVFEVAKNSQPGREGTNGKPLSPAAGPQNDRKTQAATHNWSHSIISAFILFHLIVITCWAVPSNFVLIRDVKQIVRPYMVWSGLFQSWDTFAPNPIAVNSFVEAVVITQNHQQKVWAFPRMSRLGFAERYEKERYRKFAEVLPQPANAVLWPGVAKHIARMFDNPADPPEMILLIDFQAPITPWKDTSTGPIPKPRLFYEYVNYAQPGDLQ